jgi:hypothetical protein
MWLGGRETATVTQLGVVAFGLAEQAKLETDFELSRSLP